MIGMISGSFSSESLLCCLTWETKIVDGFSCNAFWVSLIGINLREIIIIKIMITMPTPDAMTTAGGMVTSTSSPKEKLS